MMASPWGILDFEIKFEKSQAPTGELALCIREVEDPAEGMVICTDNEVFEFQVRA
jgi:hypothetical protein